MQDIEDRIAGQIAVVAALEQLRLRERDPAEKEKLRKDQLLARDVLEWLRELRREMQHGPE